MAPGRLGCSAVSGQRPPTDSDRVPFTAGHWPDRGREKKSDKTADQQWSAVLLWPDDFYDFKKAASYTPSFKYPILNKEPARALFVKLYQVRGTFIMQTKTTFRKLLSMVMAIAIPVALQNLLSTTGSMVDTIMLGRLGETEVGAVGLCAQFTNLMFSGYWGFIGGGMMFISQYWGEHNEEGICRSYGIMLSFLAAVAAVFTYLAVAMPEWVMSVYTSSEAMQKVGVEYLHTVGWAYPFMVLAVGMSTLLRSIERVKIPLVGGIVAVVTNCTCNYILIFGKLGFPALGARGAAYGTILANIANVLVIVILAKACHVPFLLEIRRHFGKSRGLVREFLAKSYPIILNEVLIGVGNMMINIVLGHQADSAIAATAVFRTLEGLIIAFFSGFSSAATVLVGKEVGAGNHEEAFSRAYRIIYLCQAMTLIGCLAVLSIHAPLLHAMGLSGDSYRTCFGMFTIYTVIGTIRMGNWSMNDTYRSAGDSAFGSLLEITFMFAMVQPAIHIANDLFHAPFLLVFALCYVDEPIRYIIMQTHMYSRKWIKPVSDAGRATIGAFREKYGIRVKERKAS